MSNVTPIQPAESPAGPSSAFAFVFPQGEQRAVFRGVSRQVYESLCEAPTDGRHIHLAYDGRDLEIIMVTSNVHEYWKELLSKFVNAVTFWLNIDYMSCGQTTWQTEMRGLEADLSYYFDAEKVRVAREALARKSRDRADYPHPDLAIEIDVSHPQIDRPSIYADLGVVEVWRFVGGQRLLIEHLQTDGSYAPAEASRFLPVSAVEILGWLTAEDAAHEAAWNRRLNEWAMELGRQVSAQPNRP
jgi:Uma2 family endonuclease